MRSTVERLHDIQEAIANIEKYTKDGHKAVDENELIEVVGSPSSGNYR